MATTPNCALCKWHQPGDMLRVPKCMAQGERFISDVCNKKNCRKLYKEKETN